MVHIAPPGEYDWTCASFGPPESTTQTANWSAQPFCAHLMAECRRVYWHRLANTIEIVHSGATLRIRLNLCFFRPYPSPQPKRQVDRFSRFCATHVTAESQYTLQWAILSQKIAPSHGWSGPNLIHDVLGQSEPTIQTASRSVRLLSHRWRQCPYKLTLQWDAPFSPQNCPFPLESQNLNPHLIHGSLGPPESSTEAASRSVQPFLQGSLVWQTDLRTDRPRYSVGSNRP